MIEFTPPDKTSIAELQREADEFRKELCQDCLKDLDSYELNTKDIIRKLLEYNGCMGKKPMSIKVQLGLTEIEIIPKIGYDGAYIAQLGGDPHMGSWGVGNTVEDACNDLLREVNE